MNPTLEKFARISYLILSFALQVSYIVGLIRTNYEYSGRKYSETIIIYQQSTRMHYPFGGASTLEYSLPMRAARRHVIYSFRD